MMNKKVVAGVLSLACLAGAISLPAVTMTHSVSNVKAANSDVKEYGRLSYVENKDGTLTVVSCAKDVVWVDFDGTIDGKYISAIDDNAFSNCIHLKYVHFGDSITSIGESAFSCTAIEKLTLPPYLKNLSVSAFDGCTELSTVCIFNYRKNMPVLENHAFDDCAENIVFYCPTGSPYSLYCLNHNLALKQSNYYWVETPSPDYAAGNVDDKAVQEGSTEPTSESGDDDADSDSSNSDKKEYSEVNTKQGSGGSGSSSTASAPTNAEPKDAEKSVVQDSESARPVSPATDVVDIHGDTSLQPGEVSGGTDGVVPDNLAGMTASDKYSSLPVLVRHTYDGEVIHSDTYGDKIVKNAPSANGSFPYTWIDVGEGYEFSPSGMVIKKQDYVTLCNCVALEYGANWVPEWEMALVAEVVFNRYAAGKYASLHDVIAKKGAFEHSEWYVDLDCFSGRVNDRVVNAVNTYLAYPDYFTEGYTSFRGDGTWNYFW